MSGPLLYSTNPLIKLLIQERFFGDIHYVWCSETFDSALASPYTMASLVSPSSNPKEIYRDLGRAVSGRDQHNSKILNVRSTYAALSVDWVRDGVLTSDDRDELLYMVNSADFSLWRPVLYVIPRDPVTPRLRPVPASKRASHGPEFIIEDLRRNEVELIEL